jgi:hypothetical protein
MVPRDGKEREDLASSAHRPTSKEPSRGRGNVDPAGAARKSLARKHPGPPTEEWQRHTIQLKLRVGPLTAETIRARAKALGYSASEYVSLLVQRDVEKEAC